MKGKQIRINVPLQQKLLNNSLVFHKVKMKIGNSTGFLNKVLKKKWAAKFEIHQIFKISRPEQEILLSKIGGIL